MTTTMRTMTPLLTLALLAACGTEGESAPPPPATVDAPALARALPASDSITLVSAQIGSRGHQATGPAQCRHEDNASIYDVKAEMWMVRFKGKDSVRNLSLTVWRPHAGDPDRVSLSLATADGSHQIDTVQPARAVGEATVRMEPYREGSRIEIRGTGQQGEPIRLTVECPRFGGIEAVGG